MAEKFNLDKFPETKQKIVAALNKLGAQAAKLNSTHAMPNKGMAVFASLAKDANEIHGMVASIRKMQGARDADSKHLLDVIAKVYNSCSSARDMQSASDALQPSDITEIRSDIESGITEFKQLARSIRDTKVAAPSAEEAEYNDRMNKVFDALGLKLSIYKPLASTMPNGDSAETRKQSVLLAKLPVLATLGNSNVSKLATVGLKATDLDGYTVIADQLMFGVNLNQVKDKGFSEADFLESGLEALSKRLGKKHDLVSSQGYTFRKIKYFWIMRADQMSRFLQVSNGGPNEWAFPFN